MQPASRRVDVQHCAVRVLNKNRIRRALEQVAKALLAIAQTRLSLLAVGNIARVNHHPANLRIVQPALAHHLQVAP